MLERLRRIVEYRKVLGTLVRRDLRIRYARSVLGYLWTLIDPLAMTLVYWFVFGVIYSIKTTGSTDIAHSRSQGAPYVVFLLAGLLAWNWFNNSINETARALYSERLLVRSTNLPRELWVIRVVIAKGIEHLMSLPILIAFILLFAVTGDQIHLNWRFVLWIPALILEFFLCVGLGLVMAPVTALVDDFIRIVRILLRMGFYLTPIVYSVAMLDKEHAWAKLILQFNPLTGINDMYRLGFLSTEIRPDYFAWGTCVVITIFWLFFGMWVFRKLESPVLKEI